MAGTFHITAGLTLTLLFAGVARRPAGPPAQDLGTAAAAFLHTLAPQVRSRAQLRFDASERTDWHFVPRERAGVTLGEMDDAGRAAARGLLRATLSAPGMLKVESVMSLDAVLRDLERAAGRSGAGRDPAAYDFVVFGDPAGPGAWGWRIEGHHVSLNFTIAPDGAVAVTPAFLGANPAEVRTGERAGQRVLAAEEDLARELLASLSAPQRRAAMIAETAPGDILAVPGRALSEIDESGLPCSEMAPEQTALLRRLLAIYTGNLRDDIEAEQVTRIEAAGLGTVRFAWAGSAEKGRPHYYRLSGPTFVIEYDNTQNGANHVHTVWRDRTRDFGRDLLKEHFDAAPADHGHDH